MRTVFAVEALGGIDPTTDAERLTVRVLRSPFVVDKDKPRVAHPLLLTSQQLPDWALPDGVRERGRRVRDSLLHAHPAVASVMTMLAATPVGQQQPIFVMLSESEAEQICWETLCDANDKFVALDSRWPVGRIIDPTSAPSRPPSALALPVRMMALISAFGIKGQAKEWQMLRQAVVGARAAGLPVRLKVVVGETTLRQTIDAEIAAGLTDVEDAAIDNTPTTVVQTIQEWAPNILHCFCHGLSEPGAQWIELATAGDYLNPNATSGSVRIDTADLEATGAQLPNPWLLTLNCCSSGQAAKNLQSMAHQVVAAGFPAAVAMLEPVDAEDAHKFSGAFYRALFAGIARAVDELKAQPRASFEWAEAMVHARKAICDGHQGDARNAREWALPLLYVRGIEPLSFERPHAMPEPQANVFKARARVVAQWLKEVGLQKSEAERLEVIALSLDGVPKAFWPKTDGTFDTD